MKYRALHRNNYYLQTHAYTQNGTHAHAQPCFLYSTTPITAFTTVVTAITVAAIEGQDGCSFSKIDSNKHLPENSANPKEQETAFECPSSTCVNNYTLLQSSKLSQNGDHTENKSLLAQMRQP